MSDCSNLKPSMCGDRELYFAECRGGSEVTIVGADDTEIIQGADFGVLDGVVAYDSDGNEIEVTAKPSEIETCEVGEHTIEYSAFGKGSRSLPSFCGVNKVFAKVCDEMLTVVKRVVNIIQASLPTISGVGIKGLDVGEDFDPLEGVSATDANGNVLDVTYSGTYFEEASGDPIATFESDYTEPLKSLKIKLEPIQDLSNGQPSADNVAPIYGWNRVGIYDNVKRYGVKWNGVDNVCTERLFDAKDITLDTTNFCDHGVTNPNYNNPFDNIYPWSEMKQCNVDLTMYRSGNYSLKECITAWYGDANFVTEGTNEIFVGRYRPEFWHTRYADEDGNICWVVAESEVNGYIHAKEAIDGIGFATDDGNGGVTCGDGQPLSNIVLSTIQTRARNSGMELQNVYSLDAQIVLYLVEYGNMNIQQALGNGCSNLYRQNANDIISAVNGNTITVPKGGEAMFTKGATLDVGASNGAVVLANRREVQGYVVDGNNLVITLDSALDASVVGMYVSIHGSTNADLISDRSGYIGADTKANVNYRGSLLYTNRYQYILGIYRQDGTNHIWLCNESTCMDYTALNTSVHRDTGRALPTLTAATWLAIGKLNFMEGVSTFAPIASSGGNSVSPVGDQQYVPLPSVGNTILLLGGRSSYGWGCGVFCGYWGVSSGYSVWSYSARPLLK